MFGFLNIYKPKGKTSHDVVAILRRVTKIKQIGHTGTLDPFAEGVLPICIGKATRLIEYLNNDKAYIGTVQLGKSTTTYDLDGDVINVSEKIIEEDEIVNALNDFRGDIEQIPPIYSAIKVNGKKLYEYARNGEDVKIKSRRVNIKNIEIISYDKENRLLELYISCSQGTYIRSIANDLGEKLGIYGHLIKLIRVQAGDFRVENSVKVEDLKTTEDVIKHLIYPAEYLNYPNYELDDNELEKVSHGMNIKPNSQNLQDGIILLMKDKKIISVGKCKDNVIKNEKVFI